MTIPKLFQPVTFRTVTARNRIAMSPMCQYSASDGMANDWHVQHYGARAAGGAGIVFTEATAVAPAGRITPYCLGLWNDVQQEALARVVAAIKAGGAVPGVQLGHAGRKAGTDKPWLGSKPRGLAGGGGEPVGASALAFDDGYLTPRPLDAAGIAGIRQQFAAAARRARLAGFQVATVHAAHGYLLNSFLSPLTNHRDDAYGGDAERRARLLLEVVASVRQEWPEELPLFVRLSCTDWVPGGVTIEDTVPRWMKEQNVTGGWMTAEYSMLPYSTLTRKARDISKGKIDGRSQEIQRLIGRAMRAAIDLEKIGPRTLWLDCDVLQADGGTRTAAITGSYVALSLAIQSLQRAGKLAADLNLKPVAAVSVGIVESRALLDLSYVEDVAASVDMNLVMNGQGEFIELQGTGEEASYTEEQLAAMLALGKSGISQLLRSQQAALEETNA